MEINLLNLIDEELIDDGFDTELSDDNIKWKDGFGAECEILKRAVAYNGKSIAWWQHNEVGKDVLRIRLENGMILTWRPKANHHSWGFSDVSLKWIKDILLVEYRNKHTAYRFRFDGLAFERVVS